MHKRQLHPDDFATDEDYLAFKMLKGIDSHIHLDKAGDHLVGRIIETPWCDFRKLTSIEFQKMRVPVQPYRQGEFERLQLRCDLWVTAHPGFMWDGGRCHINLDGMATLLMPSANLQVTLCFWGRRGDDPRIFNQLNKVQSAMLTEAEVRASPAKMKWYQRAAEWLLNWLGL